ncbi:protein FLUORESCENT IN BLUE LIGHT, chloroplastic-like isoform X2 [Ananas comosus]|uniref:Protein FLUORESCENT IN BLUE LIGHT, chloroplastic-like isoform X2 n=1 Tax=Ananas comosus TaxID=4615 RepID=A0A6P5G9K5_ANACO|nr:protein FLUORESCENT IN BLUE LIGHT, chloroplastic-like isoform X2 [Ananas comosus]
MVLLLRFSPPPPPRRISGEHLRRLRGGARCAEKVMLIPCMAERVAKPSIFVQCSSGKSQIFSKSGFNSYNKFYAANSEKAHIVGGRLCGYCDILIKHLSDLQGIASSIFVQASIIASSFELILPSKALAETCEADNSFFNMPLLFAIAMIGATVGGLLARQRRGELKRLNDQLRQINAALRRQAKIESYAPTLSYAPVGSKMPEMEVIVDPRKEQLITHLRSGKNYLRNQSLEKAFEEFKAALELARDLGDHVEEKKAARGLGASLQRQGKYKEAIKYHSMVLDISKRAGEDSGVTEAYGAIADCYTELGELEQAGRFYDMYIARLENE